MPQDSVRPLARPVIGISTYVEPASWGAWSQVPAALIPHDYVRKVEAAGGIALLVPPPAEPGDLAWAHAVIDRIDGLILAGGVDVEPARYGQEQHPAVQAARQDRDAAELALAVASAQRQLPTLGICRGMQVMAVAAGGTLEQHLPDRVGHNGHSPAPAVYGSHPVVTAPGSRIAALLGESVRVPSYHHQSVLTHPGYEPTAWEPQDRTLEAMEDSHSPFRLAVQWHPEVSEELLLFTALIDAARPVRHEIT
ncbi:gamma-glutamyl-gamma-aminobutyrate hydrolase family protein [Jatrophihabitans telluris]|uniref:Gamma-glutamyl-gamma-aminobutyrate hydrolase family protein n=1 Tax=Jatrophihabitans telluris TaxID=2038343 RepID=A0ABY4QZC9_9ACTN|nr:gamma-glutamyl-gamma-aminobutyrate hydrolase family protein [Jatrophihabitans telluris]UQX88201.1 gamma-glutamyl-gamma-aminobutyrate hydrolase family protein [Jatrophihabitans telluris]